MKTLKIKIALFAIVVLTSCQAIKTAVFDQYSYQKTTELKVETIILIENATSPYENHKEIVEKLLLDIEKLKEYEKNKPNNEITFAMWTVLSDKEKNLVGSFFKLWKEKQKLSPTFVEESKKQIEEAFDLLIQYEIKKDKTSKDNLLAIISQ
ncbi:hypothetical protein FIA58_007575 [Flavobacterium jejuense]|uniref:Lipoprotein n=1 Tax=Flavobacterium jejuense TaxID=1544455 RepID=A0ABX0IPQ3_9FLAO|nr:hypothetical protein [Flavobacterium jejuense]NHN25533.1 hypothetical protein [Flavobacterium jejuense]